MMLLIPLPVRAILLAVFSTALSTVLLAGCARAENPEAELGTMTLEIAEKFGDVQHISTADLTTWLADPSREPPQLLDAREVQEYAVSHLPGAVRITPDASADQVIAMTDPTRPIVVYCSVGYRSSVLVRRLQEAGVKHVLNLEGSVFKWANEGRPLVRDSGATPLAHPYNDSYGRMLHEEFRSYR